MKLFFIKIFNSIIGFVKTHQLASIITAACVVVAGVATPVIITVSNNNNSDKNASSNISSVTNSTSSFNNLVSSDTDSTNDNTSSTTQSDATNSQNENTSSNINPLVTSSDTTIESSNPSSTSSNITSSQLTDNTSSQFTSSQPADTSSSITSSKPADNTSSITTPDDNTQLPPDIEDTSTYYDETRVTNSNMTFDTLVKNIHDYVQNSLPPTPDYTEETLAVSFSNFDVFGYNITEQEILDDGIDSLHITTESNTNTGETIVTSFQSSIRLSFKTAEKVESALYRDVSKFETFLSNKGNPGFRSGNKNGNGFADINSDIISKVANGDAKELKIYTMDKIITANGSYNFVLVLSSIKADKGYTYQIYLYMNQD